MLGVNMASLNFGLVPRGSLATLQLPLRNESNCSVLFELRQVVASGEEQEEGKEEEEKNLGFVVGGRLYPGACACEELYVHMYLCCLHVYVIIHVHFMTVHVCVCLCYTFTVGLFENQLLCCSLIPGLLTPAFVACCTHMGNAGVRRSGYEVMQSTWL